MKKTKLTGIEMISHERQRQIDVEGWDERHDDLYADCELAVAARCYALPHVIAETPVRPDWPWDSGWWKPSDDPIRNLTKAGALIAAEIDRLMRMRNK